MLRAGWNAVFVQTEPTNAAPAELFRGTPVDKVTTFFTTRTPVEFIQDPGAEPWKQKGWRSWFAPERPESVTSDLFAVNAGQCYLIHATASSTWTIRGTAVHKRTRWRADSYNLVGFPIDPTNPPTFQAWFAGSSAHQSTSRRMVYFLDGSAHWRPVEHPETTLIGPNVAYWVYCQGASDYQGPLDVALPVGLPDRLDFGTALESLVLQLGNRIPTPLGVSVELASPSLVPLSYEQRVPGLGEQLLVPITERWDVGSLAGGSQQRIRLSLNRAALTERSAASVLILRDDVGTLIRVPVLATQP